MEVDFDLSFITGNVLSGTWDATGFMDALAAVNYMSMYILSIILDGEIRGQLYCRKDSL
jgi:hypothetical protein